jgi:HSP20 family protein
MFHYLSNNRDRNGYSDIDALQREMDRLFGPWFGEGIRNSRSGAFPALNIGASSDAVHVYVYAPGMNAKDFEITLQQNVLSIDGNREPAEDKDCTWYLRERFSGGFRRVVTLPDDVDPDRVAASYADGVLHLQIKRREAVLPRQISVK